MSELKTPKTDKCNDLHGFLKALPAETLEQLYNYPAICLAVYRETPEIAKQFIARILFIEQPVPQAVVSSWCPLDNLSSTTALSELKIWKPASIPGGLAAWELCPIFKENLKKALLGGGNTWSMFNGSSTDGSKNHDRDIGLLDTYAMSRWRCLLHYMVDSSTAKGTEGEGISTDAVKIILHANLMKRNADGSTTLTSEGFQFLLLDTQSQVWHFMLQYLNTCDQRNLNLVECLSMLFQLSFSTLGKDYTSDGLSTNLLVFLQHLREFGLVYQRKRKHGKFYPTRLALNFTSKNAGGVEEAAKLASKESKQGSGEEETEGYIIVETNYRVYAYTESKLQISLLGLFTEMLYRFPNVVVGVLTRDSIRQAFRGGINAKQIISYLEQHAHPRMLLVESSSKSILPPTVVDQIKLWENERNRFSFLEGVVYNQFLSEADFVTLRDYAQSITVLLWQNERTRTMVVTQKGNDDVKRYWKRYSKNAG